MNGSISLSIRLMVYNNEEYIGECLDGISIQKTNFPIEVIVGDDFSNDKTLDIIKNYLFPENIQLKILKRPVGGEYWKIRQHYNHIYNFIDILKNCSGTYVALCDGDDYWTDPLKLQKQVDFLEANPLYGICFHKVTELNQFKNDNRVFIPNIENNKTYSISDYLDSNKTASCSIVYRKDCFNPIPEWFLKIPFGDLGLILTAMKNSNSRGYVFAENMGVYRIHGESIHGSLRKNRNSLLKAYISHIRFTKIIQKDLLFEKTFKNAINKKFGTTYRIMSNLIKKGSIKYWMYKFKAKFYFFLIKI